MTESTGDKIKRFLKSPILMIVIFALIATAAVIFIILGIFQEKSGLVTACIADGRVVYDDMGDIQTGLCEEPTEITWSPDRLPLRVRAFTDNPHYNQDPDQVVRGWIRTFNRIFNRELLVYTTDEDYDVEVHVGAAVEVGQQRIDADGYVTHTAVDGELSQAIVVITYIPDRECETRVALHELGHVFMLAHSHELMSPVTECGGPLRFMRFPDHAVRLIREMYPED